MPDGWTSCKNSEEEEFVMSESHPRLFLEVDTKAGFWRMDI